MSTEDLGALFRQARLYGRVRIMTCDRGTYHASIEFNTAAHTKLEASSDFDSTTPEQALKQAIAAAQGIVDSVTGLQGKLTAATPP